MPPFVMWQRTMRHRLMDPSGPEALQTAVQRAPDQNQKTDDLYTRAGGIYLGVGVVTLHQIQITHMQGVFPQGLQLLFCGSVLGQQAIQVSHPEWQKKGCQSINGGAVTARRGGWPWKRDAPARSRKAPDGAKDG